MSHKNEKVMDAIISYLRTRGIAAESINEFDAEASLLFKAADMLVDQREEIRVLRDRNIRLQRQIGEFEARDIGADS